MTQILLGCFPKENNLYIQLNPNEDNFTKPYDFIILSYGEKQIKISTKDLFDKLEELFKEVKVDE